MGEIFTNHVSDDLTSKIYKELIQLNSKRKKQANKKTPKKPLIKK